MVGSNYVVIVSTSIWCVRGSSDRSIVPQKVCGCIVILGIDVEQLLEEAEGWDWGWEGGKRRSIVCTLYIAPATIVFLVGAP